MSNQLNPETNYKDLLSQIIKYPPYSDWTLISDHSGYRDANNHYQLTEFGLLDWRDNTKKTLIEIAKELNILPKTQVIDGFSKFKKYVSNDISKKILIRYLETRKISLPSFIIDQINPSHYSKDGIFTLSIPIVDFQGQTIQFQNIRTDEKGAKSSGENPKTKEGKGNNIPRVIKFGDPDATHAYIFEGFEDAASWYSKKDNQKILCIATCGCTELPNAIPFLNSFDPDKRIFILDNDKPGLKAASSIDIPCTFLRPTFDYDFNKAVIDNTDNLWKQSLTPYTIDKRPEIEQLIGELETLLKTSYTGFKKDLLTKLPYGQRKDNNEWVKLPIIKESLTTHYDALCYDKENKPFKFLKKSSIPSYLTEYSHQAPSDLLFIKIPAWDGRKRLEEIADQFVVKDYTSREFYLALKDWTMKAYGKIFQHVHDQHVLVLLSRRHAGGQGVGKSVLIDAVTKGYGLYRGTSAFDRVETNFVRNIYDKAVNVFNEIDKIEYDSMARLKDIIDRDHHTFDLKFRDTENYRNCTSYIGSANTLSFFKDDTGNRRFWCFEILSNKFKRDQNNNILRQSNYPGDIYDPKSEENRMQLIAEAKYNWEHRDNVSETEESEMSALTRKLANFSEKESPEEFDVKITKEWHCRAGDLVTENRSRSLDQEWDFYADRKRLPFNIANRIFETMAKDFGLKAATISTTLKRNNLFKENLTNHHSLKISSWYLFNPIAEDDNDLGF